jgi:hypothetical protein
MSSEFRAREKYKLSQYRLVDERCEELGLGRICVLCRIGVPGGSYRASAHHEIISKGGLPGIRNWETLFAPENIASACREHHQLLGHLRLPWLKAMVALKLARAEQYREDPFRMHWAEEKYPLTAGCLGDYGYGSRYFQTHTMPESLRRLYKVQHPDFEEDRFCEFCRAILSCKARVLANSIVTK